MESRQWTIYICMQKDVASQLASCFPIVPLRVHLTAPRQGTIFGNACEIGGLGVIKTMISTGSILIFRRPKAKIKDTVFLRIFMNKNFCTIFCWTCIKGPKFRKFFDLKRVHLRLQLMTSSVFQCNVGGRELLSACWFYLLKPSNIEFVIMVLLLS